MLTLLWRTIIPPKHTGGDIFENILRNRGVDFWDANDRNEAESKRIFLHPKLSDLHDPFLFPGMDKAVERILLARERGERVVIFWDYDVDGVSGTALLVRFFSELRMNVSYRLPHRVHDGYGMKTYFIDELHEKWVTLVISVDCGTRDIEVVKHAKNLGIDIIITDHHAVPEIIPAEVIALLSPKLPNTPYPFTSLSGSGMAFKLLSAIASKLYEKREEFEKVCGSFIDFAALGTISDMMPITYENRTIVQLWLKQLSQSKSSGLRKLIFGKDHRNADIVWFHIGPRINAAGRMETAHTALKLLIASDEHMDGIIEEIEWLNAKRRQETEIFFQKALGSISPHEPALFFLSNTIHHGIIGLIAWRLTEQFWKVSIVLRDDGEHFIGSARSPEWFHLSDALESMKEHFIHFWWHACAAGFTLKKASLENFKKDLFSLIIKHPTIHSKNTIKKTITYDAHLPLLTITKNFVRTLHSYGPFGIGFEKPRFLISFEKIPEISLLWDTGKHLRFHLPIGLKMVAFGFWEHIHTLRNHCGKIQCIVEIQEEFWRGKTNITLFVQDILL